MNILIVDDEIIVVALIKKHVDWQAIGIGEVFTAYNAEEAKRRVREGKIDLILCDIEMPQENGLTFLAWVKRYFPAITSIILTAYPDFQYAQTAVSLNVKKYLLKPISFEELSATIRQLIGEMKPSGERGRGRDAAPGRDQSHEKQMFYINLISGNILPTVASIEQAAAEAGLSVPSLEPKAIVYIKAQAAAAAPAPALRHIAEELFPGVIEVQLWENLYWLILAETTPEDVRAMCERFLAEADRAGGGGAAAYYQLHVKLATLSECAYNLRQIAVRHSGDGQRIHNVDPLIEAVACDGDNPDRASSWSIAEAVMDYIHVHYAEPIGRREIEEALHMNGDYLNRITKGVTGYSLIQYIQYYRVLASKRLMSEGRLSVAEAGAQVGFENPSYFCKVFKKWTEITPYEFCSKSVKKKV